MSFDLAKLDNFPTLPGVYLMKNRQGVVLYVGKAKNIRQRVKQYFVPGRDSRDIIPILVEKIDEIDTIVVRSEKEALILENTLIKKHKPQYNALLKDDKTYVALKINHKNKWPMVQIVRYRGKPANDGLYFGPYPSAHAARATLELIHKLFPLRQCTDQELARRTRPCILYDMKHCIAPCVGKCTKEEYDNLVDRTARFLRGQDKEIVNDLYAEMEKFAEKMEFERANAILTTIRNIESTLERQRVEKPLGGDADVLAVFRQAEEAIIAQLLFRDGKLMGSRHYDFSSIVEDDAELLTSFLLQHYLNTKGIPHEILLPIDIPDAEPLGEILSTGQNRLVKILCPQKGEKKALVQMAYINAEATFKKEKDLQSIRERTLLEMKEQLHLKNYPSRMECLDNSNIQGHEPVAALITFTDGLKDTKGYRKYKVKTVFSPDDYSTMHEILMRRYKRAEEEDNLPDLIIIDGGKGHLNIGIKVLKELNIVSVDIIGVAKEESRHTKGLTEEKVYLPERAEPIVLNRSSPILLLLQQIRDEAHRFAITFHRKRRNKQALHNILEDLPGIGPAKGRLLLKHFGSVKQLKLATREQLEQVKGLSKSNIETLVKFLGQATSL